VAGALSNILLSPIPGANEFCLHPCGEGGRGQKLGGKRRRSLAASGGARESRSEFRRKGTSALGKSFQAGTSSTGLAVEGPAWFFLFCGLPSAGRKES
jgi:hypothetical protein